MASIVVIDSEETVRSVIVKILENKGGYHVSGTGDFNEALGWLRVSKPDLVLTNVFLRGIAGHDAMKRLRSEFPEVPVLMVSGLPDEKVIKEWLGDDGFDVFPKPFTYDLLLGKVRGILNKSATAQGSAGQ